MGAPLLRIDTNTELPSEADAVVIGGGIAGACTAYFLARRGMKVALIEKGFIGAEQSSRNWGWCRQQNRDARELPMAIESLRLWDAFAAEIGEDVGFRRCGLLYLSDDEAEIAGWARWCAFAKSFDVTSHALIASEATQRGVASGKSWKGGVFSPSDGTADPSRAAPIIARGVMKAGGTVHQMCAARGLETEAGKVSAVVTEKGLIRTRVAILAGGAWSSLFCRHLGLRFPQASVRSSILAVGPDCPGLPDALHTKAVSVTRRGSDGFTIAISGRGSLDPTPQAVRFAGQFAPMFAKRWRSLRLGALEGLRGGHESLARWRLDEMTPMERNRVLDPAPDRRLIRETFARAQTLLPALRDTQITASWAGYIDSTPDGVPAIGEMPGLPGLMLATGFSGHGFGIGPGAGRLVADLVTGAAPIVDPAPYNPARFAGSSWGQVADF